MFGPTAVTVAAHPQLATALRDGDPVWLHAPERGAFGVPDNLRACAAPVIVAAEPLGMLLLATEEAEPFDAESRRLLRAISAAMGFALLRDRLIADLREAANGAERGLPPPRRRAVVAGAAHGPQACDRLADDPRHLHLRYADALADLGLRQVFLEAQPQHLALARGDRPHELLERRAVLGEAEALLGGADRVAERFPRLVLVAARRRQRRGAVGARRLQRLEPVLLREADRLGDLRHGRRAAQVGRELRHLAVDPQRELLQVARHAHRPGAGAEVALDLAEDRRHGVARERHVAAEVEAVDRLHQAQARDLEEVVERLLGARVAAGELAGERQKALDEHLAIDRVATVEVALEERAIFAGALRAPGRLLVARAPAPRSRTCHGMHPPMRYVEAMGAVGGSGVNAGALSSAEAPGASGAPRSGRQLGRYATSYRPRGQGRLAAQGRLPCPSRKRKATSRT